MQIKKLYLKNYRNYINLDINFDSRLNIIIGDNAQGKTNIIEAIYLLAITKSFLTNNYKNLINYDNDISKIKGNVFINDKNNILEIIISNDFKKVKFNKKEVSKLSDYISKFNVLVFSPNDLKLIKDIPNIRRRFLDIELSQLDNMYLKKINEFNILLKNRNEYLKYIKNTNNLNNKYLDIINLKYASLCVDIYMIRKKFIDDINKYIKTIYKNISNYDGLYIKYVSNVSNKEDDSEKIKEEFLDKINKIKEKEINYGSSILGIKRDDFVFYLGEKNLINYGSQGQQKLAVLALKLAEIEIFNLKRGDSPILLLDDLFSELDIKKRNNVIKYISDDIQTIITTTDLNKINKKLINKAKIFKITNGKMEEEDNGKKQ